VPFTRAGVDDEIHANLRTALKAQKTDQETQLIGHPECRGGKKKCSVWLGCQHIPRVAACIGSMNINIKSVDHTYVVTTVYEGMIRFV